MRTPVTTEINRLSAHPAGPPTSAPRQGDERRDDGARGGAVDPRRPTADNLAPHSRDGGVRQ
jgi:hypothetical protein